MIFDSHAHLVSADFKRYPPTPLSGQLDRPLDNPMTAERLLEEMDALGIERAVAVQRAHVYGYHNDYVCDAAKQYPERLVAVCCIDAQADDAAAQVKHWIGERGAVGLRLTEPHKGADMAWFASAAARQLWLAAREYKASVCIHMYRWNRLEVLAALPTIAAEFSDVPIILDHISNLLAEQGAPDHGVDEPLRKLIPLTNVYFKLTTINLAKLKEQNLSAAPMLAQTVKVFGAQRVLWGSDVAQSAGTYAEMLAMANEAVSLLSTDEQRAVLHDTGVAMYWR